MCWVCGAHMIDPTLFKIFHGSTFLMGLNLFVADASRSHSDTVTLGTSPPDYSARRIDLYLTTHNIHKRQTSMPQARIGTRNPSKPEIVHFRLRPRGDWD